MKRLVASAGSAIAMGVLATGILAATPVAAQEGALMRTILGVIGIIEPEKPEIEYRERAPLALPPNMELRPPVDPETVRSDPQWPNDPVARAQRERETAGFSRPDTSRPLTIEEMRAGRLPGSARPNNAMPLSDAEFGRPLSPDELRAMDPRQRRDAGESVGLTRRSLSDPPSALLQPAPQ
ncbi:MAG: hypothetical protein EA385_03225 [Salinarimonadaceae bacterium]|nr:MAG: hypothetical protein EA385_03225 [Salinarimonadaceae bacterium]